MHRINESRWLGSLGPRVGWSVAFALSFATMAAFLLLHRDIAFRGDAAEIWSISRHYFDADRTPSLFEYRGPFAFRVYNLLQRAATAVGASPEDGFRIFSSVCFAVLGTWLLPALAVVVVGKRARWTHALGVSAALFYFFRGYFQHPQVDILALTLFLASVRLLFCNGSTHRAVAGYAVASILFVFSIWTRFNYVVALPFLLAVVTIREHADGKPGLLVAKRVLVFGLAPLIVLMATVLPAERSPQDKVLIMQLTVGLRTQKVEWNAADSRLPGAVEVLDPVGARILDSLTPAIEKSTNRPHWVTPPEYAAAVARDPLAFAYMWTKHLFNGLDLWYESVYVRDFYRGRLLRSACNFFLLEMALVALWVRLYPLSRNARGPLATALAIAIPALSVVPFVIEVRFFLPLLTLLHSVAIVDARETVASIRSRQLLLPIIALFSLAMLLSLETARSAGIDVLIGPR